jgi:signal transduction histidine kinase
MRRLDRRVEEQRVELEQHARVLQHVDRGVFLVDESGVVRYWNPAAAAITGLDAESVLGRPADGAIPGWATIGPGVPVATEPGPGSVDAKTLPFEIEGRELWLSISGVKFEDGVVYAFRNLTEERALEELKSDFIATVSHELRTPLAAIYGCARTLLRPDLRLGDEDASRLLEVIAQESERLTRIVADILLANQLDAGRLRLTDQEVDMAGVARDVVDEMRATLDGREDITLEMVGAVEGLLVTGDEDRLRQVLLNLVDNAVKYSPVSDQGLGIPHGELQRIFGKFYRVDPQQTRGVGGTGLGLYICRELVRRMEGRVWVTSREGQGSTFIVDLPLAAAPARQPQPA